MAERFDVVVVGAGASGLVCAEEAGKRNRRVLVLDHNKGPGRKILMSGGGRCNFTNRQVTSEQFISGNPHFCKSALSRYSAQTFVDRIRNAGIAFEERDFGRLFCKGKASQILDLLWNGCRRVGVGFGFHSEDIRVKAHPGGEGGFLIQTRDRRLESASLVIATGGASIPAAGASSWGYDLARQFGLKVVSPRPGLVPFTLNPKDKALLKPLAGIAVNARVACNKSAFTENLLFTHRGLSGPAILQASSHWLPGQSVSIDLLPDQNLAQLFETARKKHPKKQLKSIVMGFLPKRLVQVRLPGNLGGVPVGAASKKQLAAAADAFHHWQLVPGGTEGYRTAEVTVGGVDCNGISSKTMEARRVPGLYFVGEVLDVTGWLGGYNLQWAWSSGWCAGQYA